MKNAVKMFNEILGTEEFILAKYSDGTWGVIDRQGADLGCIESNRFNTMTEVLDRMEIYHIDYFEEPCMELFGIDSHDGYVDLVRQCRQIALDEDESFDYSKEELELIEFIGMAPQIEICNKPLDEVEGLDYEEVDIHDI